MPRFVTQMPYLIHKFLCSRASIGTQLIFDLVPWNLPNLTSQIRAATFLASLAENVLMAGSSYIHGKWIGIQHAWGPAKAIYVHILKLTYLSGPICSSSCAIHLLMVLVCHERNMNHLIYVLNFFSSEVFNK